MREWLKRAFFGLTAWLVLASTPAWAEDQVVVTSTCDYGGAAVSLSEVSLAAIPNIEISAIRVPPGMTVTVYENMFFAGRSKVIYADNPCLDRDPDRLGFPIRSLKVNDGRGFTMLVASDTQLPWLPCTDAENCPAMSDDELMRQAADINFNMREGMKSLIGQPSPRAVRGLIINGDLTAYGHDDQLAKYRDIWGDFPVRIYPGLGNHDYANNVDNCTANGCANAMVEFAYDQINALPKSSFDGKRIDSYEGVELVTRHIGSMSYSFDIGPIHFVQLHNYPLYRKAWSNFDGLRARRYAVEITNSLTWLDRDLARARNAGQAIILNMHDTNQHWPDGYDVIMHQLYRQLFSGMLTKYGVSAVFAGHYHQRVGRDEPQNRLPEYGAVPVYYSGSASQSTFLLASFTNSSMTITPYKVGYAHHLDVIPNKGETIMLDRSRPAVPHIIALPGRIIFFNEGGYIAKFRLSYTSGGQVSAFETSTMALGNKVYFDLPADATQIQVRGEAHTGFSWKDVFNLSIDHPRGDVCYKAYGTTFNRNWDNNC